MLGRIRCGNYKSIEEFLLIGVKRLLLYILLSKCRLQGVQVELLTLKLELRWE